MSGVDVNGNNQNGVRFVFTVIGRQWSKVNLIKKNLIPIQVGRTKLKTAPDRWNTFDGEPFVSNHSQNNEDCFVTQSNYCDELSFYGWLMLI